MSPFPPASALRLLGLALLPGLLGGCALLGTLPGAGLREVPSPPAGVATSASPLAAGVEAQETAQGVAVTLTLVNASGGPLRLRYTQGVNWGRCGPPPHVALARADGTPVPPPASGGRAACLDLGLTGLLGAREALTLRRTLPPLPPGTYTLTAWFDGEVNGAPLRVQAPAVLLEVR